MSIATMIFAFIGFLFCCLIGISLAAVAWYEIREKWEREKDET